MGVQLEAINITCRDHHASAQRWAAVLGLEAVAVAEDDPDDYLLYRVPGTEVMFAFQPPDDGETGDGFVPRIHLDAYAVDGTRDGEVAALLTQGFRVAGDHRNADGSGWVRLIDDDGTELCVGRSDEERGRPS